MLLSHAVQMFGVRQVLASEGQPANAPTPPDEAPQAPAKDGGSAQTATATREAPVRPRLDKLPPWRVLLHNDDVNDMVHVVASIMEITHLEKQRAMLVMLEAHTEGVALLTVAHQELAELYKDQLTSKGLSVTIEPGE